MGYIKMTNKKNEIKNKKKEKKRGCLELERERGKNDSALLLEDLSDVVAGSGSHR